MINIELPGLENPLQLSRYIFDLLLVSEGSIEAAKHRSMRRAWHMAFFSLWGVLLFEVLVENFLMSIVTAYPLATGVYRWSLVIGASSTLLALAYLAYAHYRCLMLTGKDLRFQNVVFFFIMGGNY